MIVRFAFILGGLLVGIWVYVFTADRLNTVVPAPFDYLFIPAFYLQLLAAAIFEPILPAWAVEPIRGICVRLPFLSEWGAAIVYLLPGVFLVTIGLFFRRNKTNLASATGQPNVPIMVANDDQRQRSPSADQPGS